MPEAITKYAVNSTLGTPAFRPIDEIILGTKQLFPGGTSYPLKSLYTDQISSGEVLVNRCKMYLNGTIRLSLNGELRKNNKEVFNFNAKIYINNKLIETVHIHSTSEYENIPDWISATKNTEIEVKAGDIIEVKFENTIQPDTGVGLVRVTQNIISASIREGIFDEI